jgi:hypothetical protein
MAHISGFDIGEIIDQAHAQTGPHECQRSITTQAFPTHVGMNRGMDTFNGLIRQYFPKGTDFDRITEDQIAEVEQKLNSRPRKCLERKTPASIFISN